jgi:hypothetical protein
VYLDLPYTIVPTPALLVLAPAVLLGFGIAIASRPRTLRSLFGVATLGAILLYAALVLGGKFPPRFGNHYYAAYSGAFFTLIGSLGSLVAKRRVASRFLLVLIVLSSATYVSRLSYDALVRVPRDRAIFDRLSGVNLTLSDAILPGHVLRLAAHLRPGSLIVRMPIAQADRACPQVPDDAIHSRIALVTLPSSGNSPDVPREVSDCLLRSAPEGPWRAGWLRLWHWP